VRAIQTTLPNSPTVETTTSMSSECKTSPLPIVQHVAVEEDIAWLKTSLFGRISDIGVNYKSIKRGLIDSGMQLIGFCFMRGTQALISFDSAEDMMAALQVDTRAWKNNFDELRPWTQTDGPNDHLAWVTFSNLPIMALNVTCIKKILHILGRVFGFDRISLLFNTLDTLKFLIATQCTSPIKEDTVLIKNGREGLHHQYSGDRSSKLPSIWNNRVKYELF
jgi:hypothetical protein